jgi:hypothetical protein
VRGRRRAVVAALVAAGLASACSSGSTQVRADVRGSTTTVASAPDPIATTTTTTTAPPLPPPTTTAAPRTSDACGAEPIHNADGYREGRGDAEAGRPYQADGAPPPSPEDDDDDDATVGPQTHYRAGYAQGWCDGGGT